MLKTIQNGSETKFVYFALDELRLLFNSHYKEPFTVDLEEGEICCSFNHRISFLLKKLSFSCDWLFFPLEIIKSLRKWKSRFIDIVLKWRLSISYFHNLWVKKQLLKRGIPGKKKEKLKTPGRKAFVQRHPVSCIPTLPPPPRQTTFLRLCKFYPILNNSLLVTKYTKRKNCKPKSSQCFLVPFWKL